jgi:hypothetical protein
MVKTKSLRIYYLMRSAATHQQATNDRSVPALQSQKTLPRWGAPSFETYALRDEKPPTRLTETTTETDL